MKIGRFQILKSNYKNFIFHKVFFIISFLTSICYGQFLIKGIVIDSETKHSLAFVHISLKESKLYALSDLEGNFILNISQEDEKKDLLFYYTGYEPKSIKLNTLINESKIIISLKNKVLHLEEVTIKQKENPAHRIMKNVIQRKKINNPENHHSFTYTSYNKMYVTADITNKTKSNDSITSKDSLSEKVKHLFESQHLFMTESISERKYLYPGRNQEKILASKVSGFKNSPFTLLATQMQSFSFYKDQVNVFDKHYLNPISDISLKKYFFQLEDTIYQDIDTVYVIFFRPLKNKNFDGLKGTLYINSDGWAVQNVIAEPSDEAATISIRIQQQYEKINGIQWFPVKLNTDWIYLNSSLGDSSITITTKNTAGENKLKAIARTYISEIDLNPIINKKEFSEVEFKMNDDIDKQSDEFWKKYRIDSLNKKEKLTYKKIDSLGKAENFDRKLSWLEILGSGKINIKRIDIDLNQILRINGYEGARIGLGLHTSSKLSSIFNFGGYFAYGFNDKKSKYGTDFNFLIWKKNEMGLRFSFESDVIETGKQSFFEERKAFSFNESIYDLYVRKMDTYTNYNFRLSFRMLKYFRLSTYIQHQQRQSIAGYFLINKDGIEKNISTFYVNELGAQLKFIFREKFMQTPRNKISLGSEYPNVYLNYSYGLQEKIASFDGNFLFHKVDFKIEHRQRINLIGLLNICLTAGHVKGDLPYAYLYNMRASRVKDFSVSTANSFETMNLNEFVSSSFISLFLNHNIGKFLRPRKKFNPEIELVHNMGIGKLNNINAHSNFGIKVPEKGFVESGIRINNLIKSNITGIGLGIFYRYGPYSYNKINENIYARMTLNTIF